MRILHLFSDHRWTGPADPVVNLARALQERGHDVTLACAQDVKGPESRVAREAAGRGLSPVTDFVLSRRRFAGPPLTDALGLRRLIRERKIEIVHTHLSHDHAVGAVAARLSGVSPVVIRTNHKGAPLRPTALTRFVFRALTDGYLGFSPAAARVDADALGIAPARVFLTNPAVDLERFDPAMVSGRGRTELGLGPEIVLGGIVARMQPHRRFDVLLQAVKLAHEREPNLRFIVLGRGGRAEEVALRPAAEMGLGKIVLFPGYKKDDYVEYLGSLDFKVFLVPGSDGTCRAAREAMALGRALIVARRGMLPELVDDGRTGLVVDDTVEELGMAMARLAGDAGLRARLGEGARRHALDRFRLDRQSADVEAMYEALLAMKSARAGAPARV